MKKQIVYTFGAVCFVIGGMFVAQTIDDTPRYHDDALAEFATCISESGAKFYGAYWCGHCQAQKRDFGDAVDLVPYVECALPGNEGQAKECTDASVTAYPTWIFGNGEKLEGRHTFATLSEFTGCPLPVLEGSNG